MTRFEELKNMDIEVLAEWLDKNGQFDDVPWSNWFANTYCNNCEAIKCKYTDAESKLGFKPFYNRDIECSYCELERKCRFFQDMDDIPDSKEIVKMWLESEVEK